MYQDAIKFYDKLLKLLTVIPGYKSNLQILSQMTYKLNTNYKSYQLLQPVANALHKYGMYQDAIKFYDKLLELPEAELPSNAEKLKSNIWFYKGNAYSYYSRGKWKIAEDCYKQSLIYNNQNLFTKHALATLYLKEGKLPKTLDLLDEIIKMDKNDILAYKTKLEILMDIDALGDRALETYQQIKTQVKSYGYPPLLAISAKFVCVRFAEKVAELLQNKGEHEKAEEKFSETVEQYENLISQIPSNLKEAEAIVRNAYGCFLYDILERTDDAIAQLERAHEVWPEHDHTLHKLASIYLEEGEDISEKREVYWKKAKEYLNKLIKIYPFHLPARRSLAELKGKSIKWDKILEIEFWGEVSDVFNKYQKALEPESDNYPSLHNSIVYHNAGCFLWHIEYLANKRGFLQNKPLSIPSADVELMRSIKIEDYFKEKETTPQNIKSHLLLGYTTIGSYLITIGVHKKNKAIIQRGQFFLRKIVKLRKGFVFHSQNSYAESYVGKTLLRMGEVDAGKKLLESAVNKFDKNWRAWWWLGDIYAKYEKYQDYNQSFACFVKCAEGQKSPKHYGEVRSIVQQWIDDGKLDQSSGIQKKIECSKREYELDPNGDLDLRNISDYAFDLYSLGKDTGNKNMIIEAKDLFLRIYKLYKDTNNIREASYLCWFAGECQEEFMEQIDIEALSLYIESVIIGGSESGYTKLEDKILNYCFPIWRSGQTLSIDLLSEIECCANHHLEYPESNAMIGILLQRNRDNEKALPYLEKARTIKDTFALRALMECYYELDKELEAEEVCQELYPLLNEKEKRKLRDRADQLGLECFHS